MPPSIIELGFYLAEQNRWKAVFGLTSNVSVNWQINLLVLGCFTGKDGTYDIGLLSENPSGVDTMADSRIALYFC